MFYVKGRYLFTSHFCYHQGEFGKALFLEDFHLFQAFYMKMDCLHFFCFSVSVFPSFFLFLSLSLPLWFNISLCPVSARGEKGVMLAQVLDCQNTHLHCIYM